MISDKQQKLSSADADFEARIKSSLDNSAKQIDRETQHRLQAIRQLALNPLKPSNKSVVQLLGNRLIAHWQPSLAGLVLGSMLLLFSVPMWQHFMPSAKLSSQQAVMVDLLDNPDDLDVLGDPGFYVWLNALDNEQTNPHAS